MCPTAFHVGKVAHAVSEFQSKWGQIGRVFDQFCQILVKRFKPLHDDTY